MPTPRTIQLNAFDDPYDLFEGGTVYNNHQLSDVAYLVRVYWGTSTDGTCSVGSFYYPRTVWNLPGTYQTPRFGTSGTLRLWIAQQNTFLTDEVVWNLLDYDERYQVYSMQQRIQPYDKIKLGFSDALGNAVAYDIFFPEIIRGTAILWVDDQGRTYRDSSYATLACGLLGSRQVSDTGTFIETFVGIDKFPLQETIPCSDKMRFNPRRMPPEIIDVYDEIAIVSSRHATITDWQFKPNYKIYFSENNDGTWATTNWHINIDSYGQIRRNITHWTGDFEVGNWGPSFNDVDSELWGSLFNGGADPRMKGIMVSAMINDRPLTYTPQFAGNIIDVSWSEGKVSFSLKDKIKDLPNRNFVFDYRNLGSAAGGKSWGIVKKIVGTDVMFDDYGDKKYVQVKKKGRTFLQALGGGLANAAIGFIGGNWPGAGVGFARGFFSNTPTTDRITNAYYEISDYDAIPDDLIRSGQKIKFYAGSVSGIATNLDGPLVGAIEHTIGGGTMRWGIEGTLGFEDTNGIHVGDYLYIRQPIVLNGSPNEIFRALLTGSNIDYPYSFGGVSTGNITSGGVPSSGTVGYSDFADNWDDELQVTDLMNPAKVIDTEDSTPFEEIKELTKDLQISFYVNETNKFAVRTIRPRALIAPTSIATYTERLNILDGFSFKSSTELAAAGFRMFYAYSGKEGVYRNGFNKKVEIKFPNAITGVSKFTEIESKWIHNDDDAKVIAWRTQINTENGGNEIQLPTTLYGVINSINDIVAVTHRMGSLTNRLFEIEEYTKDFSQSRVQFKAVDVQRLYSRGNCKWSGTNGFVTETSLSGFAYQGLISAVGTLGSLTGTILASLDAFAINYTSINDLSSVTLIPFSFLSGYTNLNERILAFGSITNQYTELFTAVQIFGQMVITRRGLLNTIPRTRYPNDIIYDLGPVMYNADKTINFSNIIGTTYRVATTSNLPPNIGTSFRFF